MLEWWKKGGKDENLLLLVIRNLEIRLPAQSKEYLQSYPGNKGNGV
jgi:hypothetical protein